MLNPLSAPSDNQRNIVLTGFMGTGKTTVGRILARKLRRGFLDTDAIIEQRHGKITEIFATQGEDAFRAMEQGVAAELGAQKGLVIATGGRLLLDPANVAALSAAGYIYSLTATVGQIYSRVNQGAGLAKRPLLAGPDPVGTIAALLEERGPQYRRFAQVAAGVRRADTVAAEIVELQELAPTILQAPGGARTIVGINLFAQLREILPSAALHVITASRDWTQFGPLINQPEDLTIDPVPGESAASTVGASVVHLGVDRPAGNSEPGTFFIPTSWDAMDTATDSTVSQIVDLAALQPAQPDHRQLFTDGQRVVAHFVANGWSVQSATQR